jgi:hypothetical protein
MKAGLQENFIRLKILYLSGFTHQTNQEKVFGLFCLHSEAAVKLSSGLTNGCWKLGDAVAMIQLPFPSVIPIGVTGDMTQPMLSLLKCCSKLVAVGVCTLVKVSGL